MIAPILASPCCCGNAFPETCCESFVYCGDRASYAIQLGAIWTITAVDGSATGTFSVTMNGTVQRPPGFFASGCSLPYVGTGTYSGNAAFNQLATCGPFGQMSTLTASGSGSANFELACGGSFCGNGFNVRGAFGSLSNPEYWNASVTNYGLGCFNGTTQFAVDGLIDAAKVWSFGGTQPCPIGTYGGVPECGAQVRASMSALGFAYQIFNALFFPSGDSTNRRYHANTFIRNGDGVSITGTETITISVS